MSKVQSLNEIVEFNAGFKTSVNLYLSLNKQEKVLSYIPTRSSSEFLRDYLRAVKENKEQATLLIGPYGKGKSHLLLVLLAILSMDRNPVNSKVVRTVASKFGKIDEIGKDVKKLIEDIWKTKGKFLPVIISDSRVDLDQSFLLALNDALKREGLDEIVPDTYYSIALDRIDQWECGYPNTYAELKKELKKRGKNVETLREGLRTFAKEDLDIFSEIYPAITAGTKFNPLAVSEVLPLYKSISEKLVEDFGYSGIYVIFDEFSKYIESLDGNAAGNNMKLLQNICELATDSSNAQVFFTMVAHKSIKEYGTYLSSEIINAFTGIEGRLIEKYFITSSKNNYELVRSAIVKDEARLEDIPQYVSLLGSDACEKYYQLPAFRSGFEKKDFESIVLKGCYPLTPVAAYLLLNISEKVAQNERTLFTFISNDEPNSMARFIMDHTDEQPWSVNADLVYDYFSGLFKKEVANEYIHNLWLGAEYALGKCDTEEQRRLIKSLAIILIVNKDEEFPADEKYIALAASLDDGISVIEELKAKELIYKKGATNGYVFKTRAGSELKKEIKRRRELKGDSVNYGNVLEEVTGNHYVVPRKYNSTHMMTRYFTAEYMDVADFLGLGNANTLWHDSALCDGKIVYLYSFDKIDQEKVKKHFFELGCSQLIVVCPVKAIKAKKQLRDYEIVQEIRTNNVFATQNEVLTRELPLLEDDLSKAILDDVARVYDDDKSCVVYEFDGDDVSDHSGHEVERVVGEVCEKNYPKSPRINNEIINRRVLSSAQTRKARLNIIGSILRGEDDESFYEGTNQEATVYRSLICRTGLKDGREEDSLTEIIHRIDSYITSCAIGKKSLTELIKELTNAPFGMREGVIPVYFAYALKRRKEDIVVYFSDGEVQITPEIIVGMCEQSDDYSLFVSKEDVQKEQYIDSLNRLFSVNEKKNLSDNRIKDILICMQRWFRGLPQVTRNLLALEEYILDPVMQTAMAALRKQLQKVEINPYEILFVSLPDSFQTAADLSKTAEILAECVDYYDKHFNWIQNKTVDGIYIVFGGNPKKNLYRILTEWYAKQSALSKNALHGGRITNLMTCIEKLNVYDNQEVMKKLVKAVSDVYVEDWSGKAYDEFVSELSRLKAEIENIRDDNSIGKMKLSFTGHDGKVVEKYYDRVDEGTGSVLRNIIEDALDEYDDLSVNDRVGILLEMIEKVIG